ncbi:hypothetical protein [Microseira wollei]|uniref:hypothetical protein n=1 Tax=Microseira wollei TaxID=467598 RepID=UPI001CFE360D|nr:hypothetical protein [Microseira wollei]
MHLTWARRDLCPSHKKNQPLVGWARDGIYAHPTRKTSRLWGGRETGSMPIPQEKPASCGVGVPPAQSIGARSQNRNSEAKSDRT